MAKNSELITLLAATGLVIIWSCWNPFDRLTWWLEALPVLLAIPILMATRRGFPLTRLAYYLIFIHALILLVGAHYTYAQVPFGFWLQDLLEFSRNPYDRLGHIAQGFIPALLAREVLLRNRVIAGAGWLAFLVVCFCLALSAFYELLEWFAAVGYGDGTQAFLGTQGDIWDAQWDMLMALSGAILALLILGRAHNRQLQQLSEPSPK